MAGWPPAKNTAFTWYFYIRDASGDLVTGAAGLDVEYSIDGGTFADVAGTETEEGSGLYSCAIAAGEMNGDAIALICKSSTAGAKTAAQVIYTSTRQVDSVLALPGVEPSAVPGHTDGIDDKLNYMFAVGINKLTQTSTTWTLRDAADGSDISSATVSDDGTTTTRGAHS